MKITQIKEVLKRYGEAWENQDSELILRCFTKKGVYQESPLSRPYRGHAAIRKFWETVVCRQTKKISFKLKNCYVSSDGKTGFAEWECKNTYLGKRQHMAG